MNTDAQLPRSVPSAIFLTSGSGLNFPIMYMVTT